MPEPAPAPMPQPAPAPEPSAVNDDRKLLLFFDLDDTLIASKGPLYNKDNIDKHKDLVHLGEINANEGQFYPSSQKEADKLKGTAAGIFDPNKAGLPYEPRIRNIITSKTIINLLEACSNNDMVDWYIISRGGNSEFFEMLQLFAQDKNINPNDQVWGNMAGEEFKKGEIIKGILDDKYSDKNYEGFFLDDTKKEKRNVNETLTKKGYNVRCIEFPENSFNIAIKKSDHKINKRGNKVKLFGEMYDIEPGPDKNVRTTDGERAIIGEWIGGRIDWFSSTATTLIDNDVATNLLAQVENFKPEGNIPEAPEPDAEEALPGGIQDVSYGANEINQVMTITNAPREVVEDAFFHSHGHVDRAIEYILENYKPEDLPAEVHPDVKKLMEMGKIDEGVAQQLFDDAGGDLMIAIDFMNAMPTMPAMPSAQQEELPPEVVTLKKMGKIDTIEAQRLFDEAGGDLMVAINKMVPDMMGGGSKGLKKKRLSNRKRSSRRKASRRKASRRKASRGRTSRRKTSKRRSSRRRSSRRRTSRRRSSRRN